MHLMGILAAIAIALVALPSAPANADEPPTEEMAMEAASLGALEGREWRVTSLGGEPPAADSEITLSFADGRVAGRSACNRYTASATLEGASLVTGEAVGTRMACPEPVMAQETAFLAFIGTPLTVAFDPDGTLVLTASDGTELRATRG